jgi:hypothetical protein
MFVPSVPRLVFWSVSPAVVASGIVIVLGFSHYTFTQKLIAVGVEVLFAMVITTLASPHWYLGASRLLAATAAALYVLYFVDGMTGATGSAHAAGASGRDGTNAFLGLVFFALPCAIFAIRGSLLPRHQDDDRSQAMGSD